MQTKTWYNTLRQTLNLKRLPVLLGKVVQRVTEHSDEEDEARNIAWLKQREEDFGEYAKKLDAALWQEASEYAEELSRHAESTLANIDVRLGGGGFYTLLYFITRYKKPSVIVETGVAAGYSSHAFLTALEKNIEENSTEGKLFSSDFPYFRIENPEKYIGILVPDDLKANWNLYIDGDKQNLPRIVNEIGSRAVDIFHYDSDKRFSGRKFAMGAVADKLASDGIIIMDDINDNSFFRHYCENADSPFKVFSFGGKNIGLLGNLES